MISSVTLFCRNMILKFTITAAADEWTNFTKIYNDLFNKYLLTAYYELVVILYAGKLLAGKTESLSFLRELRFMIHYVVSAVKETKTGQRDRAGLWQPPRGNLASHLFNASSSIGTQPAPSICIWSVATFTLQ